MKNAITQKGHFLKEIPEESVWLANFVSEKTRKTYKVSVREFLSFHRITRAEELRGVNQAYIIAWRDALVDAGAGAKTVNTRISAISSLFKHLCERQVVRINPTTGVKRPRVDSGRVKTPVITPGQVRRVLDAPDTRTLKGCRDRAILHILFYTGCRVSEVAGLKVRDFYEDGGYYVLDFTVKGGKRNKIAIHPELKVALSGYLAVSGHDAERDAPLILAAQRAHLRKPLGARALNKIFHRYARAAGLPVGVTPHTARATFITQALEKKCPLEAVQRSVGHSKINTTQMYDKRLARHRESASFAVVY